MGKLVWNMIQSFKKLWVEILSDRYFARLNIHHSPSRSSDSVVWSSILHARDVLKDGYSWLAGSGTSSFWTCPKSYFGFLGTLVPYIDIHDLQLQLKM